MTAVDSGQAFANNGSVRCYRLNELYFWVGVAGVPIAIAIGIGASLEAWRNLDGSSANPLRDAVGSAIGASCFALLYLGLIAYYVKFRLYVSDTEIVRIGLLGTKRIDLSEVGRIKWRLFTQDVVLYASKSRLRIDIDCLSLMDQAAVASFLHQRFPADMHQGWEKARRPLRIARVEPIHWGRIAIGAVLAAAIAIPTLFLAAWIDSARDFERTFVVIFFSSLAVTLLAGHKLGWIELNPRIVTAEEPVNTPVPAPSPSASRSPSAPPSRG